MKLNTPSIISIVLVVIVGFFILGSSNDGTLASIQGVGAANNQKSLLVSSESTYDFGTISMKNGNVTKEFEIINPTEQDITVSTIFTSCMCTEAFVVRHDESMKGPFGMPGHGYVPPVNEVIKAGESRTVRVIYDPNAHGPAGVGQVDRFVMLTDSSGGTLQLEIQALVTP